MIREITYLEALREALREEMLRDERVILLGEDIGIYARAIKAEPTVILSLSFDHRVVDGASATQFLQRIKQILEKTHLLSS